jgi:hypothetical protein
MSCDQRFVKGIMKEKPKVKANLILIVGDVQTNKVRQIKVHNMVVDSGINLMRDLLNGDTIDKVTYIGYGTSSADSSAGMTDLVAPSGSRYDLTGFTPVKTNKQIVYNHYVGAPDNLGNITEAGLFTAVTSGTMFCRAVFEPINKTASTWIQVYWTISFSG